MRQLVLTSILTGAMVAGVMVTAGCGPVKIGRITADPSRFRNQTVRVTGNVVTSVGLMGTGGYQIRDETGSIYVISRSGVPSTGSRVTVTGTVTPGVQVLGQPLGTTIRETHHSVK